MSHLQELNTGAEEFIYQANKKVSYGGEEVGDMIKSKFIENGDGGGEGYLKAGYKQYQSSDKHPEFP
jgi:hypothetical protein